MSATTNTRPDRSGSAIVTLPGDTEILITRKFDAPKALVWEALTRPEHVLRWWGPEWCPLVSAEIDLRVGGTWRYVSRMIDDAGEVTELAWSGEYRDIDAPHQLISTERFEAFPDAESLNTMTLTEHDGITTLETLVRHTSKEHRDGHIDSGMEGGMQDTFNRLDQLLDVFDSESERFRRVATRFSEIVAAVPASAWENAAFCEGWDAQDPVKHLVEWVPGLFGSGGLELPVATSADDDPVAAWEELRAQLQAALDDPEVAGREIDLGQAGRHTVARGIDQFVTGDVIVHGWDVATAAGLAMPIERMIDGALAAQMVPQYAAIGEMLVASGHYSAAVPVPDTANIQERLVAATGRDPYWKAA
jgi:uncharacterized protein (TIGR03086 family)